MIKSSNLAKVGALTLSASLLMTGTLSAFATEGVEHSVTEDGATAPLPSAPSGGTPSNGTSPGDFVPSGDHSVEGDSVQKVKVTTVKAGDFTLERGEFEGTNEPIVWKVVSVPNGYQLTTPESFKVSDPTTPFTLVEASHEGNPDLKSVAFITDATTSSSIQGTILKNSTYYVTSSESIQGTLPKGIKTSVVPAPKVPEVHFSSPLVRGFLPTSSSLEFPFSSEVATLQATYNTNPVTSPFTPQAEGTLHLVVTDLFGRTATSDTIIKQDTQNPTYSALSLTGGSLTTEGIYSVQKVAQVKFENSDNAGVASLDIIKGSQKVNTIAPVTSPVTFQLSETGEYSFILTDVLGNKTTIPFSEFTGASSKLLIDTSVPVITPDTTYSSFQTLSGIHWASSDFTVNITDSEILAPTSVTATLGNVSLPVSPSSNGLQVVVPHSRLSSDTTDTLTIKVLDAAGNANSFTTQLRAVPKLLKPTASTSKTCSTSTTEGNFCAETFTVTLGLQGNDLITLKSATPSSTTIKGTSPTFLINSNQSSVEFTLVDTLDRVYKVDLKDLLGLPTSKFFFDSESAKISLPEGLDGGWFKDTQSVPKTITLSDEGIRSYKLSLNGKVISSKSFQKVTKSVPVDLPFPEGTSSPYNFILEVVDLAGNTTQKSFTVNVDTEAPVVSGFTFTDPSYVDDPSLYTKEHSSYGIHLKGTKKVAISVEDADHSSGLSEVTLTLLNKGAKSSLTSPIKNGVAEFEIPSGFKGYISATASDKVGNVSSPIHPAGVISGDENFRVNTSDLIMDLPTPIEGNLYKDNLSFSLSATSPHSGIRTAEFGSTETPSLTLKDFKVVDRDQNLMTKVTAPFTLPGDYEGTVWLRATDNAGFSSSISREVEVDATAPVVSLSFHQTNPTNFYNSPRTATLTVVDKNFDPSLLTIKGATGDLGAWTHEGNTWTNTLTFSKDGQYQFTVSATDKVGHSSNVVSTEQFKIDRTAPVVTVGWSSNNPRNGNYYNTRRSATITVIEENFDATRASLGGSGSLSGWVHNGSTHTTQVNFPEGVNTFRFSLTDQAGNTSPVVSEKDFIVDVTRPVLSIQGITNGVAYYNTPALSVGYTDINADLSTVKASLTTKKGKVVPLTPVSGANSLKFSLASLPTTEEYDDLYTLRIQGSDKAGNLSEQSLQFLINRHGSVVKSANVDYNGKYLKKVDSPVTFQEQSVEKLDTSKLKVLITKDGSLIETLTTGKIEIKESGELGSYTYVYSIPAKFFTKDGSYTIQLVSTSTGGRQDVSKLSYSFVVDSSAPEVTIKGITSNGYYYVPSVPVNILLRDASSVEAIIKVDGKEVKSISNDEVFNLQESPNPVTFSVTATDKAGNTATVEVKDVYITSSWLERWKTTLLVIWVAFGLFVAGYYFFARK